MAKDVYIIAEAGVNHNGNIQTAFDLVDVAVEAGVDAIKFQLFKTENLVTKYADKADYQIENSGRGESQFEMLKKLELNEKSQNSLLNYCKEKHIEFITSPFDLEALDFVNELGIHFLKIPSGEITNRPYLEKAGKIKKKVILSTGMCNIEEIADALNILNSVGTLKDDITILHCNTEYPTPYKDVNLMAMKTIKEKFGVRVGYSDHTEGIEVCIAATALGAEVLEKHFTLDKRMEGPDHAASLNPEELKLLVQSVKNVGQSLGDGIKKISDSEKKNISIVRKSIVARISIKKGEILTQHNLTVKRPGTGINPMRWYDVIGSAAARNFKEDELITL